MIYPVPKKSDSSRLVSNLSDDADETGSIGEVSIVQMHAAAGVAGRLAVQVLDAARVERRRAPEHPVHLVALVDEELREI